MKLPVAASAGLLALHFLTTGSAGAATVTLYDGSTAPVDQGWTRFASAGDTGNTGREILLGDGTTEFNSVGSDNRQGPYNSYALVSGETDDFLVSMRLKVISSSSNQLDAGLAFSAFGSVTNGTLAYDRTNSIAILANELTWNDQSGGPQSIRYAMDTTTFHTYSLHYLGGKLDVFVDATAADIRSGTAVPVLSRSGIVSDRNPGTIVFGDETNDAGYNSDYVVDFITMDVPEPGSLTLASLAALGLLRRRRR